MKTLYNIVPIDSGYHYIGLDIEGNHVLKNKAEEYEPIKMQRQAWRDEINELEAEYGVK